MSTSARRVLFLFICGALAQSCFGETPVQAGKLPFRFERNVGQFERNVQFLARVGLAVVELNPDGFSVLTASEGSVKMRLNGARALNQDPDASGQEGATNYVFGDRAGFQNVPAYARVRYHDVYPGIDMVYYGSGAGLEYDFVVSPGSNPGTIQMSFDGTQDLSVDAAGDLLIKTAQGVITHHRPFVYQEKSGSRQEVAGARFVVHDGNVTFEVGEYDESRELLIDPFLIYSTYLGGRSNDQIHAIATDAANNVFVAGETWSPDFPTGARAGTRPNGASTDAFVTKLDPTLKTVLFTTFLIGKSTDIARAVSVDANGDVYVGGVTYSADFPITAAAFQIGPGGLEDGFVAKLSGITGNVVYSTFLAGSGSDFVTALKVNSGGNARVTGYTNSNNFPTTSGALTTSYQGGFYDAFYAILNPTGSSLAYSTFLGGSGSDIARGIALGSDGTAYIAGGTDSANFPVRSGVAAYGGGGDAFVAAFSPTNTLTFATFLGGSGFDSAYAIATDTTGVYVTGSTSSIDFNVTAGALQSTNRGYYDIFVAKFRSSALVYSTYLGGSLTDTSNAIAVDGSGTAYVTGFTVSSDFPTVLGIEPNVGQQEGVLFALNPSGASLLYSSYFGGSGADLGEGIAYAGAGAVYVAGSTTSNDLMAGAYAGIHAAGTDSNGFVIQVGTIFGGPPVTVSPSSGNGASQTFAFHFNDPAGFAMLTAAAITVSGSDGLLCNLYYTQGTQGLMLFNDAHNGWLGPITLGSGNTLQNTTCSVSGSGASAIGSGNSLTLTLPLTFKPAFVGSRTISVQLTGADGQSTSLQTLGSWIVPGPPVAPAAVSLNPSSGTGLSQSFVFQFSDQSGYALVAAAAIIINGSDGLQCTVYYTQGGQSLLLFNDAQTAWLGPITLGSSSTLQNNSCSITGTGASASGSGNLLTLTLPFTFKPAFSGNRTIAVQLTGGDGPYTGFQTMGSWTVAGGALSAVSVNPASGTGLSQSFVFQFSDPPGYAMIAAAAILINGTDGQGCTIYYTQASQSLQLFNDSQSAWLGPIKLGSAGSLQNSTCSITGTGASASGSGSLLTLTLPFTFKSAFAGNRTISVQLTATDGSYTGLQKLGSWTVSGAAVIPSVVSISPSSGGGLSQTFGFKFTDASGYGMVAAAAILITGSDGLECAIYYTQGNSGLLLFNDAHSAWLGPITLGSASSLQNSTCSITGTGASATGSGNDLILTLPFTFKAAFAGNRTISIQLTGGNGLSTSMQTFGSWVP